MKNASGWIKVDLLELYDLLESKLMALGSLVRTKEKFAEFLEPLVESCLPETVFRAWERSRSVEDSSPQDSARSLDKLLCFLRNERKVRRGLSSPLPGWELHACRILVLNQMNLIALQLQPLRIFKTVLVGEISVAFLVINLIILQNVFRREQCP
ncbi:integrase catalytic domain-containing protein [Trichonephila clavipes]|nr:integrase catalytic domain-containing protein [Trichonephila clavipes]